MTLACWQATIMDDAGNIVPNASIEVLEETAGQPPAQCFSDRDGSNAIGSVFAADGDGFVRFFAAGGAYQITATSGAFSRVWRYVAIGTAQEADVEDLAGAPTSRTITAGTGLTGGGSLAADRTIAIDKATDADVRAAASNKTLTADLIESASASVTLTDAATIAVDWDAFITASVTLGGNRTMGLPSNGQPGTWRNLYVFQDATGSRTLSWASGYQFPGGIPPTLTPTANAKDRISLFCVSASLFEVYLNGNDVK